MSQLSQCRGVATNIYQENGYTVVRYHSTAVVQFNARVVKLHSGGWHTATTKTRMNQAANQFGLGYQVVQRDFSWYVITKAGEFDFVDGITIDRETGKVSA